MKNSFQTELAILDLERLHPPYYFEGNFEHNVMVAVLNIVIQGSIILQTISSGKITTSNRKYYMFELVQQVDNAEINGEPNKNCSYHLTLL